MAPKPPALPPPLLERISDHWRRSFSHGIRQSIYEGFAFLFLIIALSSVAFYTLGFLAGFEHFSDHIPVVWDEFERQEVERPVENPPPMTAVSTRHAYLEPAVQAVKGLYPADPREALLAFPYIFLATLPLLLFLLAELMAPRITRSIRNLTAVANAIKAAEYNYPLVVEEEDEIGDLAMAMEEMRRTIQTSQGALQQANAALAVKLKEQQDALQQARNIQQSFMPLKYQVKNATVASLFIPQQELSGDFFSFKELADDQVAFIFGDIQGHGVPASLNMMSILTSFRMLAEEYDDPAQMAAALNRLCGHNAARGPMPLVTAVIGIINQHDGTVEIVNAGHPAPIYVEAHTHQIKELTTRDPILGLLPDYHFSAARVALRPDDKLLLYTDGITEARNADREMFEANFRDLIARHAFREPESFLATLSESIEQFLGTEEKTDDILLSCLTVEVSSWSEIAVPPASREGAIQEIIQACARRDVPNEVSSDIHLALDELITNAQIHGNQLNPEKQVHIRYSVGPGVVRVAIRDEGPGFVPDIDDYHITSEQLMERGRRGIYLVKSLMDEMTYNEHGTEVSIVKRFRNGAPVATGTPRYDPF